MKVTALRKSFPKGVDVPQPLRLLCAYTEQSAEEISCDFILTATGYSDVLSWFDNDEEVASQFVVFGVDRMHSLYGYWLYDTRTIVDAPIVYLNSEGVGNVVLANTIEEFFALLALGKQAVGMVKEWDATTRPCSNVAPFRMWLQTNFGILPPTDGRTIVEAARRQHPDLDSWVGQWSQQHYGN